MTGDKWKEEKLTVSQNGGHILLMDPQYKLRQSTERHVLQLWGFDIEMLSVAPGEGALGRLLSLLPVRLPL